MSEPLAIEATDRYGGNYPDPATVCEGQCEGMGRFPVYSAKHDQGFDATAAVTTTHAAEDEALIEASGVTPGADGWAFLKCADCEGTGLRRG